MNTLHYIDPENIPSDPNEGDTYFDFDIEEVALAHMPMIRRVMPRLTADDIVGYSQ